MTYVTTFLGQYLMSRNTKGWPKSQSLQNYGDMEALAGVPSACTDVKMALVVTEMVDTGAEDTAGTT